MPWWLAGAPVLLGGAPRALLLRVQEGRHGARGWLCSSCSHQQTPWPLRLGSWGPVAVVMVTTTFSFWEGRYCPARP